MPQDHDPRQIKPTGVMQARLAQIDRREPILEKLSDAELRQKTLELKDRLRSGKATGTRSPSPNEGVDLCSIDPGFDVDLYIATRYLRTMTAIWMGYDTVRAAVGAQRMLLTGDRSLSASMQTWLALSPFARESKLADLRPERPRPETARPKPGLSGLAIVDARVFRGCDP